MPTIDCGTFASLGYPRIGERLEWKMALEQYERGELREDELAVRMKALRLANWRKQIKAGVRWIPSGDFSLYDTMLDHSLAFGIIPERFEPLRERDAGGMPLYFAMARGVDGVPACKTAQWFDTFYHYVVPEWTARTRPKLLANPWRDAFEEARGELGLATRPVVIGPFTFVRLSKGVRSAGVPHAVWTLVPVYAQLLGELEAAGAEWVQIDEPALAGDLEAGDWKLLQEVYAALRQAAPKLNVMLQTYFDAVDNVGALLEMPVAGVGLDFVHDRGRHARELAANGFPEDKILGAGVVDGRNVWRTDLSAALRLTETLAGIVGEERLVLQPSCSLQHVPVTVRGEERLHGLGKLALAFADEKLKELAVLGTAIREGRQAVKLDLADSAVLADALRRCPERNGLSAGSRAADDAPSGKATAARRRKLRQARLALPPLSAAAAGGLTQSRELRLARKRWRSGEWSREQYLVFMRSHVAEWVGRQEKLGQDVLELGGAGMHGTEEYFAEQLDGFLITGRGWVQSCGTHCVKPPILFGDIAYRTPVLAEEAAYAASIADRPVKALLPGPLTLLNRSYVRTDISRQDAAGQLAAAIRTEIRALEAAGIGVLQLDEPALREGAPLKKREWDGYLQWAGETLQLATGQAADVTQIELRLCFSDETEMLDALKAMDADLIWLDVPDRPACMPGALAETGAGGEAAHEFRLAAK
ncbi:5-methyltetrahydropteroyltriglutamate-- homocysteine methyltransferase [Paenibacillus sp. 32O-W]|uniref:5-methyltetrahydropteroyltriglutamate-- homocysteine S-methyltransferase n=1 Tax=Paenibacillus sp. 32O-W TaxID=1695218 RepID=UPI000722D8E2|nr:5-methyltetrahydropteroyltriglutamate--homocysteine S-methyltransferase [Paenibacillus sp. 32O-W]ALS26636.1 5-methyltetrahydropteroyltriglutamate-- homocysteine methyltransferase [Paenibacillus sp. 32O-W]